MRFGFVRRHSPLLHLPSLETMKFSDLVSTSKSADDTKATAEASLAAAADADSKAHAAVVGALQSKPSKQAALVDPSGDIDVYGLNADASDFVLSTIPGDFDLAPPPPPPPPPDPTAGPAA